MKTNAVRQGNRGPIESCSTFLSDGHSVPSLQEMRMFRPNTVGNEAGMLSRLAPRWALATKEIPCRNLAN